MNINKKVLSFGTGILFGVLAEKAIKSKLVKKVAVSTVAGGLKVKESIDKTIEVVKENAEDIVAEAKLKNLVEEKEASKETIEDIINSEENKEKAE